MSKKKILVVSHAAVLEVNRKLFEELALNQEFEVFMIVPSAWTGDLIKQLSYQSSTISNIKTTDLPVVLSGNGSLFFYKSNMTAHINAINPDIIFIDEEPWSLAAFQVLWCAGNRRCVFYTKQNLKKRIPLPFRLLQSWVFKKSRAAFSVESEVTDVLRWKNYKKIIYNLPHSFDPSLFRRTTQVEKKSTKQKLGISEDKKTILYCGRLTEEKGVRDLLKAISILDNEPGLRIQFMIIGNGPLMDEVCAFAKTLKKLVVKIHPAFSHDTIGAAMSAADILVLPSRTTSNWKEQFGRVLVEGMACGLAMLGSDSGAIGRVITRAGGGLVFREGDVLQMVALIKKLSEDETALEQWKESGYVFVQRELTHATQARHLASCLNQILIP